MPTREPTHFHKMAAGSELATPWRAPPVGAGTALVKASLLAVALLAMAGCSGLPRTPAAAAAPTAAAAEAVITTSSLTLHDGDSRIELRLDRAGPLARLGHRHVISTTAVHGTADFDAAHPERARFHAAFRVATLEVDNPDERAAAGEGFGTVLDAAAIAGTREHMLSPALLDAERHPQMELRLQQLLPASAPTTSTTTTSTTTTSTTTTSTTTTSTTANGSPAGHYTATVVFTVKGAEHALSVPVEVAALPGGAHAASGHWTVTHAQLGLQPYSAAGGLVKVADAIEIRFTLVAKPH